MVLVEKYLADTIMQDREDFEVGGLKLSMSRPTMATMFEIAKEIAKFPLIGNVDNDKVLESGLALAVNGERLGIVVAKMLLGKKNFFTEKKVLGLVYKRIDNVSRLSNILMEELNPQQVQEIIAHGLGSQRIAFFLNIITFLNEVNILKKTTGKMIVPGQ